MTILTKYSQSTAPAPQRSMKKYTMTLFVMGQSTKAVVMGKFVPTSQPGSKSRQLMTIWILMAARCHARLHSMDVKPAPIKSILSSVLKMGA